MTKTAALLTLSFSLSFLAGCHQNPPTPAPITELRLRKRLRSPTHGPDPTRLCSYRRPAQAEDCRFQSRGVEEEAASNCEHLS